MLPKVANEGLEGYLNALDAGCQLYLDEKVDRTRFKKRYQVHIRQAYQSKAHADFFGTGHNFNALKVVFEEWENAEKKS